MDFGIVPEVPKTPTQGTGLASIVHQTRKAEDLGYSACFLPDHYLFENIGTLSPESPAYDPFTTFAVLSQTTRTMKLITHVSCMLFRHPAMHARLFAQLDEASGGRMIAGIGAGWTRAEFEMFGLEFPEIGERLKIMDEAVDVMRGLWTNETFSYGGRYFTLRDAVALPKPVQPGGPPIMLGGSGNGILRRAGRWADIIHMAPQIGKQGTTTPEEIKKFSDESLSDKLAIVRAEEKAAGRQPGTVKFATTIFSLTITKSPDETRATAELIGGVFGMEQNDVLRHPSVLIGTPEDMAVELRRRRDAYGLSLVGVHAGGEANIERFAKEVVARLK